LFKKEKESLNSGNKQKTNNIKKGQITSPRVRARIHAVTLFSVMITAFNPLLLILNNRPHPQSHPR
jgi:hypothetical protein